MSPVFGRESCYVFKIYSNEEERMHIHVLGDGNEAKFWLEPKVELAKNSGFSKHELNDIQKMQNGSKSNTESTSVSVLMINGQGIMISVGGQDYFLSYNRIPWMRDASINDVLNVQMCGNEAIEWPALNVDLEIDSLRHPERYPLLIKRSPTEIVTA